MKRNTQRCEINPRHDQLVVKLLVDIRYQSIPVVYIFYIKYKQVLPVVRYHDVELIVKIESCPDTGLQVSLARFEPNSFNSEGNHTLNNLFVY